MAGRKITRKQRAAMTRGIRRYWANRRRAGPTSVSVGDGLPDSVRELVASALNAAVERRTKSIIDYLTTQA